MTNGSLELDGALDAFARERLSRLPMTLVGEGTVLFRPGDEPGGFVLVRSGRVAVYLTGRSGREILLYTVEAGETCIQTTLGILGDQSYSGEAIAETPVAMTVMPRGLFMELMESSPGFRRFVFRAFAERMGDVTRVLEQVAFVRIEERLAGFLMERADAAGVVQMTHHQIAAAIGSAREVVSRRLEALAARGYVDLDRGQIRIVDRPRLSVLLGGSSAVL
ncbi:Crp/Fnr family transcriptional regulator [Aquibium carbonis]|uniref:Crp/Fnr family transcriptional regulator n=1 Tax=Aquibium carbonis TaxID=2495581 RepID=A0A3R9YCA2_9HYPH|nr:Crp/Fnr family transcriptional regulator [Aquibium carbonis]RST87995.1 Crp/Fnr family transcriptional regulator [Aquibium carbonis]